MKINNSKIKTENYHFNNSSILDKPEIKKSLEIYKLWTSPNVRKRDMFKYIEEGEKIAQAIATKDIHDTDYPPSTPENVRNFIWFLMAQAVDKREEFESGTFRILDYRGKIYSFLNHCKDPEQDIFVYSRISTHFKRHNLVLNGESQRGLDLAGFELPANKQTLLFGRLNDGTTFIKIESHGCPPFWKKKFRNKKSLTEFIHHTEDFIKFKTGYQKSRSYYPSRRESDIPQEEKELFIKMMKSRPRSSSLQNKKLIKKGLQGGLTRMSFLLPSEFLSKSEKLKKDRASGYQGHRLGNEVTIPNLEELFKSRV